MKRSLFLLGGFCVALAGSAQAQKVSPVAQKLAPRVKAASQGNLQVNLPPAPLVGGTDTCTTPDPIVGTGAFVFDNSVATTGAEGQAEALCTIFGFPTVDTDVWFSWVAPASGLAVIESCNLTAVDTKIAAYPGTTCPTAGTAIACSDDDCGFTFQSHIQFNVTAGNSYVIQIGTYPGAGGGIGQFNVSVSNPPANDDCASAQALSGFGPHNFDNTLASVGAQGQAEAICNYFGGTAVQNDVWFTWTAPSTGAFAAVTEGLTDIDTKIAIYDGAGCPAAAAIACNDDGGTSDLQTVTQFSAVAGQSYTFQVGLYQGTTAGGAGRFQIIAQGPRPEDSCTTPLAISGQGNFPFDNVFSTTGAEGQTEVLCTSFGSTAIETDSWYLWTPNASGTATISVCPGTFMDTRMAIYNGPSCPTAGSAVACNDDFCGLPFGYASELSFSAVCGQTYLIQLGSYPYGSPVGGLGEMSISVAGSPCATPSTVFCSGDAVGTSCLGCGNNGSAGRGCANSSFAAGTLLVNGGISSVSADTMTLTSSDMPGPGLFFQANGLAASPITFGDGMLCASVGILRMGVVFPTGGVATYPGGLTPNPITIAGAPVNAGDTKHYQCWYRDAVVFCTASTFNTSNGVTLTWAP